MDHERCNPASSKPRLPADAPTVRLYAQGAGTAPEFAACLPAVLIGSRRDCDLYVCHTDVSKSHCALVNTGTAVIATDLASRSGTFVNGRRVVRAALRDGDVLEIAGVRFAVRIASAATGPAEELKLPVPFTLAGAEHRFELDALPAVIGRRNACQVVIDTPDVSLAHALIFRICGRPVVCDLGSRSGTYLNGLRVALAWLHDGDRLGIGGVDLIVRCCGAVRGSMRPAAVKILQPPGSASTPESGPRPGAIPSEARLTEQRLDEREAELARREAALRLLEQRLARREAELARREAAVAAAASEIAQFGGALGEAREVLAPAGSLPQQPEPAATVDRGTPTVADDAREPLPADSPQRPELPGPVVREPILGGLDATTPAHWPARWRERGQLLPAAPGDGEPEALPRLLQRVQTAQPGQSRWPAAPDSA